MPSTSIAILDQRRRQSTAESATSSTPSSSYSSSSSTPAPSPQSATERGKPQTKHVRRQSFLSPSSRLFTVSILCRILEIFESSLPFYVEPH